MNTTAKKWILPNKVDHALIASRAKETGAPETAWRLLAQRGITDVQEARDFFRPKMSSTHSPLLLMGMTEMVSRLRKCLEEGRTVGIHGDYDVDGMTSTALYTHVMRDLGFTVLPFVPHRMKDGYGMAVRALDIFKKAGIGTVLTCDTGSAAIEEARIAVEDMGMEVLISDHHLPKSQIPKVHALVNPNQVGCQYPFKDICGVAVAYKVMEALILDLGKSVEEVLYPYLDLVALGTVCDVMPLVDENRTLVYHGVRQCRKTKNTGLRALLSVAGVAMDKVNEFTFGWGIGPRFNAAGRIDDAALGLQLLLEKNEAVAKEVAQRLENLNQRRKAQEKVIQAEVIEMLEQIDLEHTLGLALFAPEVVSEEDGVSDQDDEVEGGWHHGIIGIVASKVVERTGRPVMLFAKDEKTGMWKGSGRAPAAEACHLVNALNMCSEHLDRFGGHKAAAGATLKGKTAIERAGFATAFDKAVKTMVTNEDLVPTIRTDGEVLLSEITMTVYEKFFQLFAPFGNGNPNMTFVSKNVTLGAVRRMGSEKQHVRLTLEQDGATHEAVIWNYAQVYPWLSEIRLPARVDFCFQVELNTWNDVTRMQLKIQDIRLADGYTAVRVAGSDGVAGTAAKDLFS